MRKVYLLVLLALGAANTYGLVIATPGYITETYAQYAMPDSGRVKYADFDDAGNLYVTHDGGSLVRINSSGQAEVLDRFLNLQGVLYAGGTTYGNALYFNDADSGVTYVRQADGIPSTFASIGGTLIGIAIDRMGRYDGKMFVSARRGYGNLYKVHEPGQYELFTQLGAGMSGHDIKADPSGHYGGFLYLIVSDESLPFSDTYNLWTVNPDGTTTEFSDITRITHIEFDTTETSAFGGLLYAQRNGWAFGSISPDGQWSLFAQAGNDDIIECITFGPDDSMYVVEKIPGDMVFVTKISAVPEPCTLLLFSFGALSLCIRRF